MKAAPAAHRYCRTSPKGIWKNVTSFGGYCSATLFANTATTAKQSIEASILPTLFSGRAVFRVALDDGMTVRMRE
jgi:hypothetical protein